MSAPPSQPLATFRDPAGSLAFEPGRVLRKIRPHAREAVLDFLESPLCRRMQQRGDMVAAEIDDGPAGLTLIHPRIPVPTYSWEWSASQWLAAADLTLTLAEESLAEGWILKDATPLNVLYQGSRPLFVDILSFERHNPKSSIWLAYGQYMRTFLLPLLMNRMLGWPLALSLLHRDGFEPSTLYTSLSWPQRLSPAVFWPITLPALLERRGDAGAAKAALKQPARDPEIAIDLLRRTFRGLRKRTRNAVPAGGNSAESNWSDYKVTRSTHYTEAEAAHKHASVQAILEELRPARVLDIGANTGEHSTLAANAGAEVVALERDPAAAERLFLTTRAQNLPIQTIVGDLARPTPAVGWENNESPALIPRLEGQFDIVLMLAVIHHLILLDQIPIPAIVALLARLTTRDLLLEWVPVADPMFQSLMRGREDLYGALTENDLLEATAPLFDLLRTVRIDNGRVLFLFRKRGSQTPVHSGDHPA